MKLKNKKKIQKNLRKEIERKQFYFRLQGNTKKKTCEGRYKKLTVRLKRVGRWSDGWVIFIEKKNKHETN